MKGFAGLPLVARTLSWSVVAGIMLYASHRWRVQFSMQVVERVFTAKFPFLGLILTAGTFQYKIWNEILSRDHASLLNPEWATFEAQTDALVATQPQGPEESDELRHRKATLAMWREYKKEVAEKHLRQILPHNIAILGNFLFIGTALLVSASADVALFLIARPQVAWLQQMSTVLLVVTVLPFLENVVRYFASLFTEFQWGRKFFGEHVASVEELNAPEG